MTLLEKIQAMNAEKIAWVNEDPSNRCAGLLTEDLQHWEEYEVYTLEDLEYYFECSRYSELHKSVHGFRPRGEYPSYGDMLEEIKYLEERLERILIQEEEEQKLAIVKFEERLKTIIESGAGDRETALRWLVDSHDGDFDREYVEDHFQLPYGYLKKVA